MPLRPRVNADEMLTVSRLSDITTYSYDANGSRTTSVVGSLRTTYQWDGANRLQTVNLPSGWVAQEQYRPDGLRYRQTKVADGASSQDAITLWDGDTPLTWQGNQTFAQFLRLDSDTQGSWQGAYGSQGYLFPSNSSGGVYQFATSGVLVSISGTSTRVWETTTTRLNSLRKPSPATDRITSYFYNSTSFTLNINLTDGATHQVGLYFYDTFSSIVRSERIEVYEAGTNRLLSRQVISFFGLQPIWVLLCLLLRHGQGINQSEQHW